MAQIPEQQPGAYASNVVNSDEVKAFSRGLQTQFGDTAKSVGNDQIREARRTLPNPVQFPSGGVTAPTRAPISPPASPILTRPGLAQYGNDLKYGKPVVVTEGGEQIVTFIRSFVGLHPDSYSTYLTQLKGLADRGVPEALNFVGFIFEFGLFNVPRDAKKASDYYQASAAARYQPALLNLAGITYFGRGVKADANSAYRVINLAYAVGPESSARVCGMGSLMAYRLEMPTDALRFSRSCSSPLAALAVAKYGPGQDPKKYQFVRNSIIAGADDGFDLIANIGAAMQPRTDFAQCRYKVIGMARLRSEPAKVKEAVRACVLADRARLPPTSKSTHVEAAISNLSGAVLLELQSITAARKGARFQHAMSVPYLPFSQVDVNQWLPLIEKVIR